MTAVRADPVGVPTVTATITDRAVRVGVPMDPVGKAPRHLPPAALADLRDRVVPVDLQDPAAGVDRTARRRPGVGQRIRRQAPGRRPIPAPRRCPPNGTPRRRREPPAGSAG